MSERREGSIVYSEARAVQIRNPENVKDIHSAVSSTINVEVDTKIQGEIILANWERVMKAASSEVEKIKAETAHWV